MDPTPLDELKTKREALQENLAKLDRIMRLRNGALVEGEGLILHKLRQGVVTLINPSARKMKNIRSLRENESLQVHCRILRRCLFYLRTRRAELEKELNAVDLAIGTLDAMEFAEQVQPEAS